MNIENENSLKNNKFIYDITKFTHLDYPEHLSCIFWFSGCNMRCDYCYNKDVVFAKEGKYTLEDALIFLTTRKNLLDAVVLSGGEASSYDLVAFCTEIKKLGFLIKLDTNGTNYLHIKKLIDLNLLDYIALDYKAPKYKFTKITHSNKYNEFTTTLKLLIRSKIKFEVRTTLHSDLLNSDDINYILQDLYEQGYQHDYYIQEFLDTKNTIGALQKPSSTFERSKLQNILSIVWR